MWKLPLLLGVLGGYFAIMTAFVERNNRNSCLSVSNQSYRLGRL
jgi:hypothetical protein